MNEKLDELIEYLSNLNYGGEFDCAIDNHIEVLKEHSVLDADLLEVCEVYGDMITRRTYLDEFIHDYYKSVIKSVCNVVEIFKENNREQ